MIYDIYIMYIVHVLNNRPRTNPIRLEMSFSFHNTYCTESLKNVERSYYT